MKSNTEEVTWTDAA